MRAKDYTVASGGENRRFYDHVRYFNKYVLNPLLLRGAGGRRSPFVILRHVGRRSGRIYRTPLLVVPVEDSFIIVLTYGPGTDWYRNLLAAGWAQVLWRNEIYTIEQPQLVERVLALPLFSAAQRTVLRLLDIQNFVRVKARRSSMVETS